MSNIHDVLANVLCNITAKLFKVSTDISYYNGCSDMMVFFCLKSNITSRVCDVKTVLVKSLKVRRVKCIGESEAIVFHEAIK